MKRLIALLFIFIFVSSSLIKLYTDLVNDYCISITVADCEDENEEKEIEKDTELKKDKIILEYFTPPILVKTQTQKFYTTQGYLLPSPYLYAAIIPPNAA